ncbi:MAG: hypothetical protein OJF50_000187 [Nitrospira sp.]|jgi:hypothetical protein|nr:hypothetical protein [Nitrospira sp.]
MKMYAGLQAPPYNPANPDVRRSAVPFKASGRAPVAGNVRCHEPYFCP